MRFFKGPLAIESDEKLMELVQGNNSTEAVEELYRRYSAKMHAFLYRMSGRNKEEADDKLQELFLKIIEKPKSFDSSRRFAPWFFAVAANLCKNEHKHSMKTISLADDEDSSCMAAEDNALTGISLSDFRDALYQNLEGLPSDHKATFLLRYANDFSIKEISEILGCPEGTVKSRLYYTIRQLSKELHLYKDKV